MGRKKSSTKAVRGASRRRVHGMSIPRRRGSAMPALAGFEDDGLHKAPSGAAAAASVSASSHHQAFYLGIHAGGGRPASARIDGAVRQWCGPGALILAGTGGKAAAGAATHGQAAASAQNSDCDGNDDDDEDDAAIDDLSCSRSGNKDEQRDRRMRATLRERKRQQQITVALGRLRRAVPIYPGAGRTSKIQVLHLAINYIRDLSELLCEYDSQTSSCAAAGGGGRRQSNIFSDTATNDGDVRLLSHRDHRVRLRAKSDAAGPLCTAIASNGNNGVQSRAAAAAAGNHHKAALDAACGGLLPMYPALDYVADVQFPSPDSFNTGEHDHLAPGQADASRYDPEGWLLSHMLLPPATASHATTHSTTAAGDTLGLASDASMQRHAIADCSLCDSPPSSANSCSTHAQTQQQQQQQQQHSGWRLPRNEQLMNYCLFSGAATAPTQPYVTAWKDPESDEMVNSYTFPASSFFQYTDMANSGFLGQPQTSIAHRPWSGHPQTMQQVDTTSKHHTQQQQLAAKASFQQQQQQQQSQRDTPFQFAASNRSASHHQQQLHALQQQQQHPQQQQLPQQPPQQQQQLLFQQQMQLQQQKQRQQLQQQQQQKQKQPSTQHPQEQQTPPEVPNVASQRVRKGRGESSSEAITLDADDVTKGNPEEAREKMPELATDAALQAEERGDKGDEDGECRDNGDEDVGHTSDSSCDSKFSTDQSTSSCCAEEARDSEDSDDTESSLDSEAATSTNGNAEHRMAEASEEEGEHSVSQPHEQYDHELMKRQAAYIGGADVTDDHDTDDGKQQMWNGQQDCSPSDKGLTIDMEQSLAQDDGSPLSNVSSPRYCYRSGDEEDVELAIPDLQLLDTDDE